MFGRKKKAKSAARPAGSTRRDEGAPTRRAGAVLGVALALGVVVLLGTALYAVRGGLLSSPAYSQRVARVSLPGIGEQLPPDIARGVVAFVQQAAEGRGVLGSPSGTEAPPIGHLVNVTLDVIASSAVALPASRAQVGRIGPAEAAKGP